MTDLLHLGMQTDQVVFLDVESTNLYPDGEMWELAFDIDGEEHQYFFKPNWWPKANARALKVGGFYERTKDFKDKEWTDPFELAPKLAAMFEGRHIVGAVPNFDENFLRGWFDNNQAILTTHYHLIDIETMIVGYLLGAGGDGLIALPWKSDELSRMIGVDPDQFDRHTALGDVRWVRAQWNVMTHQ